MVRPAVGRVETSSSVRSPFLPSRAVLLAGATAALASWPASQVAAAPAAAPATQVPAASASVADQIVVRHRASATAGERADARADAGVTLDQKLRLTGVEIVETDGSRARAIDELERDPDVLWAEPNRPVTLATDDPLWENQYGLENLGLFSGSTADADVDIEAAWTVSRGAGVTVGVVDSGVDTTHPDLAGQLVSGQNFVADAQGASDVTDGHGHGTHVAGTVAALSGNDEGVSGAAPLAKVQPLRALNAQGTGSTAVVAAAFDYAGDQGLRIVNASLGSATPTSVERLAITEHPNTLFVVAAGNSTLNVDGAGTTSYPCRYTYVNVLCVGASTDADAVASFSNYGATSVDLFAPGELIWSTYPVAKPEPSYVAMNGTSMASPLVAAAAALIVSAHPDWTAAQVKAALLSSADHPTGLAGVSVTGGRLNAARALGVDVGADGQAPAAPTGLASLAGPDRVDFTWAPSPEADLQDYRVWRSMNGTWTPVATATAPAVTISGLAPGESVSVRVTARDTGGQESEPSGVLTASALASVPVTPAGGEGDGGAGPQPGGTVQPGGTTEPGGTGEEPAPRGEPNVAAVSKLSQARVIKASGRVRGVRFQLSAPGRVKIKAVRKRSAKFTAMTRSRTLSFSAGRQLVALDRAAGGLKLAKGTWRVTVTGESGHGTVTVTIR